MSPVLETYNIAVAKLDFIGLLLHLHYARDFRSRSYYCATSAEQQVVLIPSKYAWDFCSWRHGVRVLSLIGCSFRSQH